MATDVDNLVFSDAPTLTLKCDKDGLIRVTSNSFEHHRTVKPGQQQLTVVWKEGKVMVTIAPLPSRPGVPGSYRKTKTITAVQFCKLGDHPAVYEDDTSPTGYAILGLEGKHQVTGGSDGDWIATGEEGEHWAIKDRVFRMTYEKVV